MLVLTRKVGERIVVGDGIVVTVVGKRGKRVRLAIEAPEGVPIWRGELLPAVRENGRNGQARGQAGRSRHRRLLQRRELSR